MQHAGIGNSKIKKKAAELAAYGRHGDTILAHISPAESEMLSAFGKTKNPHTGLDEHFAFMPLIIGAALGGISAKMSGGNFIKGALMGAAMGGIGQGLSAGIGSAFPETAAMLGIGPGAAGAAAGAEAAGAAAGAGAAAAAPAAGTASILPPALTDAGGLAPLTGVGETAATAAQAASGGIGQGIMDYFSSPSGMLMGIGAAGQMLSPTYEEPKQESEGDEDYVQTDNTIYNSVFADGNYDTNQQGRSGYYYKDGGGISRYASGGKVPIDEEVPYQEATNVGTAGPMATNMPTAADVHSYGTRGEFNFFPSRMTQAASDAEAAAAAAASGPGDLGNAKISDVKNREVYLDNGTVIKFDKSFNKNKTFPIGSTLSQTLNPWAAERYAPQGFTGTSTYADLLKNLAPSYFAKGGKSSGIGGGKDDKIPAMLSDGEHVITADEVSDLGDGSNDEGQRRIYKMRKAIRKHKNVGGIGHRPKAKKPSQYMKEAGV